MFFIISSAQAADVAELRKLYYRANDSRKVADEFFEVMKGIKNTSEPILLGYKAMAHLMQAKFQFNPYSKMSNFTKGKDLLNIAINKDPGNIELRFMRFCAQANAPGFLGYKTHINEDKAIVLKKWKKCTDKDLKARIKNYMLTSTYFNIYETSSFE
ncbi:MAG TPA: hypothetical protein VGD31_18025 [Sphingobacteriaceae bacterium]